MQENQTQQHPENIISGRRSFDRQFDLLAIGVHTLQRDFGALEQRAAATQKAVDHMSASLDKFSERLHAMDRTFVAKVATITVAERILWALGSAMLGIIVHLFF